MSGTVTIAAMTIDAVRPSEAAKIGSTAPIVNTIHWPFVSTELASGDLGVAMAGQAGDDRLEQVLRAVSDLLYGAVEGLLIARGGRTVATDLANELERGGADLVVGCYLVVVAQADDASTHVLTIITVATTRHDRPAPGTPGGPVRPDLH